MSSSTRETKECGISSFHRAWKSLRVFFEIHICDAQREDKIDPPINTTMSAIIPSAQPYSQITVMTTLDGAFNIDTNMNCMFRGKDGKQVIGLHVTTETSKEPAFACSQLCNIH